MISRKDFVVGQKVLLFNSRLKIMADKLHSKWIGPFVVTNIFPYGTIEIRSEATNKSFKVNGHRLKPFHENQAAEAKTIEALSLARPSYPPAAIP
ncbi:hypothetical protein QL285_056221 [Trifolium repens]|nr:hypothetical protein QL285_056221 [Trifolium repens]